MITPRQAPIKRAGANIPPTKPILIQIVVSNIFKNKKITAEVKSILKFSKLSITSIPIPVTSGNFIDTTPHITAAYAGKRKGLFPKFKKLSFFVVNKCEYRLANNPTANPPKIIIII